MSLQLGKISFVAGAAAFLALTAVAQSVDAKDWRRTVDNHYEAAAETKYEPRVDNPEWGFTLDTVMADMAWRQRTAQMLRGAPVPDSQAAPSRSGQIADRPETPAYRFSF